MRVPFPRQGYLQTREAGPSGSHQAPHLPLSTGALPRVLLLRSQQRNRRWPLSSCPGVSLPLKLGGKGGPSPEQSGWPGRDPSLQGQDTVAREKSLPTRFPEVTARVHTGGLGTFSLLESLHAGPGGEAPRKAQKRVDSKPSRLGNSVGSLEFVSAHTGRRTWGTGRGHRRASCRFKETRTDHIQDVAGERAKLDPNTTWQTGTYSHEQRGVSGWKIVKRRTSRGRGSC